MRLAATILAFLLVLSALPGADPTPAEYAAAINVAGRQRMLSQKMAKEALLIALQVDVEAQRKALAGSMKTFDESLKRLIAGDPEQGIPKAPDAAIAEQYAEVVRLWGPYRGAIEAVGGGGGDPALVASGSRGILAAAAKAVDLYEASQKKVHGGSQGTVVNIAGRQRMLSQKMAKEALQVALGIEPETSLAELAKTRALFARSQQGLEGGDAELGLPAAATPAALKQLQKVSGLWADYQARLDAAAKPRPAAADLAALASLSQVVLAEANRAVMLLEGASK